MGLNRDSEVLIVGAGPAGLALALSLARSGLRVSVLEQQSEATLAEAADDGREIALHHASMQMLETLGVLAQLRPEQIAPMSAARVANGRASRFLDFKPKSAKAPAIGYLIANHLIRRALYQLLQGEPNIRLLCEQRLRSVQRNANVASVFTEQGEHRAQLLVAADSRHSATRQALGIAAHLHDFGKTMLVCRAEHALDHEGIAWEWFDLPRTIAALPLHGRCVSLAITLTHAEAEQLAQLDETAFNATISQWLQHRLGPLRLVSPRWRYPLIATYSQRFIAPRAALVGDAAVGMHPVTAHGYNFGLHSQQLLTQVLTQSQRRGRELADPGALRAYERRHRAHTLPLFLATNAIVDLYTSREPAARLARDLGIALSSRLPPFKQAVLHQLTRGA